jgi:isoleucyl-tRNA synthetase
MYRVVPTQVDLPAMEREVLALWQAQDTFAATLAASQGRPQWTFYEGPPTANGMPGTHHVEARAFKDVFPRYKTMKGYHVPRKAGWDCHGLPVEIAVEKELGFTTKGDIEAYGVAAFNARCRESVLRHVDEFTAMTERMGYWVDMSQAYWTMDPEYVDSVWWSLQRIHERGLLVQDHRVTPYCPRCGTGLSDHELAQGYETVVDPSVYVRFPVVDGPLAELGAALLVWTTTPWTLVSNTAVAANPDVDYVVARTSDGEVLVVAEQLLDTVLGEGTQRLQVLPGRSLTGTRYRAPFDLVDVAGAGDSDTASNTASELVHTVLPATYVTVEDGTGLVHQAPAFGPDDLAVAREYGLPVVNPVRPDGRFDDDVPLVGGVFFKKADAALVDDLAARGLLFRHLPYEHSYPHCWRCHTALLYYAQPSWYIRTTAIKDDLLRENDATNWFPDTIKHGRYGNWLDNNIDWALSRNRFWGTPLPVWRCDDEHLTVVGSRRELGELAGEDLRALDPHRPFVDDVTLPCPQCGQLATRVPEVIDVWYDSGAMPFAQWGYPHSGDERFDVGYPADYIAEALDQTRGWFYTLMAIGTLVFDQSAYRNVLCLGLILDKDGRRMSKHLGNILAPVPLMDEHGADALRWFMLAVGSPWAGRRVSHEAIQDVARRVLLTYWNTASFLSLYGRVAEFSPQTLAAAPQPADRPVLDQWVLSRLQDVVGQVDVALEDFDTQTAGRVLASFVDDVSNWYVRRSRRRFWDGDPSALATLHEVVRTVTLLMAPFTPFITERVWQDVVVAFDPASPASVPSVHLASWPAPRPELRVEGLDGQMSLVRRLVELGRAARADSGVKTRQPLPRALVAAAGWDGLGVELQAQLADELNVVAVTTLDSAGSAGAAGAALVDVHVKASFRSLGRRFGSQTPVVAAAIAAADATALAGRLRAEGRASLPVESMGSVELGPDDVVVTETPREGWAVAHDAGESVALDLTITPHLRRLGLARDVVRLVQEARKTAGLQVSDRVGLWWQSDDDDVVAALREHGALVGAEVLAPGVTEGRPSLDLPPHDHTDPTLTFWIHRA